MESGVIILMGVSGSGKSTIGKPMAKRLNAGFVEADDFHPEANKRQMAAGKPLTDAQRMPWLKALAAEVRRRLDAGEFPVVVACSALKRSYRSLLNEEIGRIFFLHLCGERELLMERISGRKDHFMPAFMLDSQFDALEPLGPDEHGALINVDAPVDDLVDQALAVLPPADRAENRQQALHSVLGEKKRS